MVSFKFRINKVIKALTCDGIVIGFVPDMKGIPFRFSGSRGLYSQDEVKILISFVKALTDFEDSKSLFYLGLSEEVYRADQYDFNNLKN